MNKDQVKGKANEVKGKTKQVAGKATGDKSTEYKGKAEKQGGKAGAVLGDINDNTKKSGKGADKEGE